MSTLTKYDASGTVTGEVDVPSDLLELKRGTQAVHDAVVAFTNAKRAGSASTLDKGEVAGTGAKPWKQKGTGRARAGYKQSPVWRGGGTVFGPKPRDFSQKINKKVSRLAFRRALSEKIAAGDVRIVETIAVDEPRTRSFTAFLKAQHVEGPVLVVVESISRELALSARNLPSVELVRSKDANVYQLLRYPLILVDSAGMEQLLKRLEK